MVPVSRTHVPGLDGLRGVAVLAVVAYHLGHLRGGFVGVDLFFVLSGYLITSLLLDRTPEGTSGLRQWWGRRFSRLTPAVVLVVIAVLVVFSTLAGVVWDAIATLTWWQNWHLIAQQTSYWASDPSPLRHAWSLSIEEQFYLVWPLTLMGIVALSRRLQRTAESLVAPIAAVLALTSFLWAAYLATAGADLSRIYFGTDTRVGALLIGCAAAAVLRNRPTGRAPVPLELAAVVSAAALVALCVGLSADSMFAYRGGLAIAAVSSLVLVVTMTRTGPIASLMSVAPLRWIGVRSYGIYLWSWPVQLALEERLPGLPRAVLSVIVVVSSIVLAHFSLLLLETPMRRGTGWARRVEPRRAAWAGGLVLVVAGLVFANARAEEPSAAQQVTASEAADMALQPPTTLAPTTAPTTAAPGPGSEPGTAPSTAATVTRPRLMITGDSLAFVTAFQTSVEDVNAAGIESTDGRGFIGCGVLARAGWRPYSAEGELEEWEKDCPDQPEAERIGLTGSPDWVVQFAGGWEGFAYRDPDGEDHAAGSDAIRAAVLEQLVQRGEEAAAAGARIAWVTWVCPGEESDRPFADDYPEWVNGIMRDASAQVPGSIVIEPTDRVCVDADANGEPTEEKDVAWDREHHPEDAGWLWQVWLGPAILAADAGQ